MRTYPPHHYCPKLQLPPHYLSGDSDHIYSPGPPSYNTASPTCAILCLQTLHPYQLINIYGSFKQITSPDLSHSILLTIICLISQRYLTDRLSTSFIARAAGNIDHIILIAVNDPVSAAADVEDDADVLESIPSVFKLIPIY